MTVAATRDTRLQVQLLESAESLFDLGDEWAALDQGVAFCSPEWLASWWRHYQQPHMQLFTLALRDAAGDLVGLAPWYLSRTPGQGRVVRFLGGGEVCSDYLTILAHLEFQEQVGFCLADWLAEEAAQEWDLVELTGLADNRMTMDHFGERLSAAGYLVLEQPDVNCWRLPLPNTWEQYLAGLSKSRRPHTRALCRRNFDTGRVTLRRVQTAADLARGFEILIDLHQKRRESLSQAGCFASRQFTDFQREAATRMLESGRLRLLWIELEGRAIAVEYGFVGGDTVYYYQGGFDPAFADECPGTLMCVASLKLAIAEGYGWFDFLRGDEPYKTSWKAEPLALRQMRVVARHPSARVRHAAWRTGETIKRWARQGLNMAESWKSEAPRPAASRRKSQAGHKNAATGGEAVVEASHLQD